MIYMKKALLFDLDGTLADTLEDIRAAINHVLVMVNCRTINEEECRSVVGRGLRNAIRGALWFSRSAFPDDEIEILYHELMLYYRVHSCDFTKPYTGIIEFLERMKNAGFILGVLSNKSDELVLNIVEKLFPENLFSYVHGMRDGFPAKPDSAGVREFASLNSLKVEDVIYIGDSEVDMETVKKLDGLSGVIVTWGFRSRNDLEAAGAHPLVDNIKELEECVYAFE